MQARDCVATQGIVCWVSLLLLEDFQRFQRGCQCYLLLIIVFGAYQLHEAQADDLLCGANFTFQQFRTSFNHRL